MSNIFAYIMIFAKMLFNHNSYVMQFNNGLVKIVGGIIMYQTNSSSTPNASANINNAPALTSIPHIKNTPAAIRIALLPKLTIK
jgi:hypothetical protein